MNWVNRAATVVVLLMALTACGGGGGGGDASGPIGSDSIDNGQRPAAPSPSLAYGIKTLRFSWPAVDGASHYRLYENADGASGYSQVGGDITATQVEHTIALYNRINANYLVSACNRAGCNDSAPVALSAHLTEAIGYFKASNTGSGDSFGWAVALSADGNTLAVGARSEGSDTGGINGDQLDNSKPGAGAVYLFVRNGNQWAQQAYIKASNPDGAVLALGTSGDTFGAALALSASGDTLVVGAPQEDSNARGVDGNQGNNSMNASGAVYVFTRSGSAWRQQAYVKASNTQSLAFFGTAVSLAHDGNSFVVGAPGEGSNATGVAGNETSNAAPGAGAVYLFSLIDGRWRQSAYIKASNTEAGDNFGAALQLSGDGNTLAVGAPLEDSDSIGIDKSAGNAIDGRDFGAVYLFSRDVDGNWNQQAYVKGGPPAGRAVVKDTPTTWNDQFGAAVTLSFDGNTLAVGAPRENSPAVSVENGGDNVIGYRAGAVYLYSRSGSAWQQQAYMRSPNNLGQSLITFNVLRFGAALQLSADGNTLLVGLPGDNTLSTGVNGDQSLLSSLSLSHGAAYVFTRNVDLWSEHAYLKASNTDRNDRFGSALAISGDGNTVAVGAIGEASNATGINGDQTDNSLPFGAGTGAGAVYLY